MLQVQRRLIDGYQETRRIILVEKPSNRNNWYTMLLTIVLRDEHAITECVE
jgi:hypothetical protein